MGQTYAGCVDCRFQDTCAAAVARHMLEAEAPFTNVDSANCMLLRASKDGDLDAIHKATADGANVNTRLPMWIRIGCDDADAESTDADLSDQSALSLTPLMHAAQEGQTEAVQLLLRLGAKVDLREADGMQALHFAAASASLDCFRTLLGAGANPVATDNFGRDALACLPLSQIAASPSKREWLQLFKEANCWSTPVHDGPKLQLAAPSVSGCEAKPNEEANESDITATPLGVEEANQTALMSGTETDVEETSVSNEISVTFMNEQPNEMKGLHNADRKLSHSTEASTESEAHLEKCSSVRTLNNDTVDSEFCQKSYG